MSVSRIKKNDNVILVAGVGAGSTGKVLQVLPAKGRAFVEGVKMVKKTVRKSQDNPQGGIVQKEASVELSNLLLFCPSCKKGVKISRVKEGDKSVRKCRKCTHLFDN